MRNSIPILFSGAILTAALTASTISSQPPAGKAESATKTIPLESCYATGGISGIPRLKRGGGEAYAFDLEELLREHHAGASNVVLVRGKDIAEAVKATRWAFTTGIRADMPVPPDPGERKAAAGLPIWLVAYFGAGPSDPGFGRIQPAEITGQTIRVVYSRARANSATTDVVHYYFWVQLGQSRPGTYTLELFDAVRKEVTLTRRVSVGDER